MNLLFMKQFSWGEQTEFVNKLWVMAINEGYAKYSQLPQYSGPDWTIDNSPVPKLHTIRKVSSRYKEGMKVQPFFGLINLVDRLFLGLCLKY